MKSRCSVATSEIVSLMNDGVPAATPLPPGGLPPAVNASVPTELPVGYTGDFYTVNVSNIFCGQITRYEIASGYLPVSLTFSNDGTVQGSPIQVGHFTFTARAFDALGRSADAALGLEVRLRPPHFTQEPSSYDLELGQTLWLSAQTDIPGSLQWFFNGAELPEETNAWFMASSFASFQAGAYQVRARNAAGDTWSAVAAVGVKVAQTVREGVKLAQPTLIPGQRLRVSFPTQPGRSYRVQRAANDELAAGGGWTTLSRFQAGTYTSLYTDDLPQGVKSRFYRIVEDPPDQPTSFSTSNTSVFVALDTAGRPLPGTVVGQTVRGVLPPFQLRVGGAKVTSGGGLLMNAPNGASVTETNGETHLAASHIQFAFGPDSPLQFAEVVEINSGTNVDVLAGPISVDQLETLLGKPAGSGLDLVVFGRFHLKLIRGTFEGSKIRGARLQLTDDAALALPLPGVSGDFPEFDLDVAPQGSLRLPFSGTFGLPDETASPVTLTIPATRPLVLELWADGHIGAEGSAELQFQDGPKFGAEFSFEEPNYSLRLSASQVSLPSLMGVSDLLPLPADIPTNAPTDDATLNPLALQIAEAALAAENYAALTIGDATAASAGGQSARAVAPKAPASEPAGAAVPGLSPLLDPHTGGLLDLWRSIAKTRGFDGKLPQIESVASRVGRASSASKDWQSLSRALAGLADLQQTGRDKGVKSDTIQAALDAAATTTLDLVDTSACSDYTPQTLTYALSNLFYAVRVVQSWSDDPHSMVQAGQLLQTAEKLLVCFTQSYLTDLGVADSVFQSADGSRIAAMPRYEALEHLKRLLALQKIAMRFSRWARRCEKAAPSLGCASGRT